MIRKVKFDNFYSFNKEQEISFLAQKKKRFDYYQSKSGEQVTKVAGFIGGNGSGKTNVMRLFSFFSFFICRDHSYTPPDNDVKGIVYKNFFNNKKRSKFYIEFELDDFIFFYNFSIKNTIILKESLSVKKIKKGAQKKEIFSRELDSIKNLDKKYFNNLKKNSLPKIREDVSLITFIKRSPYSVDIINTIYNYFAGFKGNTGETGETNSKKQQARILKYYMQDSRIKKKMEDFITRFDLGLKGFDIEKKIIEEESLIAVHGVHSVNGKDKKLPFLYESRGTRSLVFTMALILIALEDNNVIVIDEIETGFHPTALNKLINYFIDENENKKAQLIFSSHSLGFMSKLDMHQIFLVEKNKDCESNSYRLNQVEGVRSDDNFMAKYMAGAYGAFPKIRV